MYITTGLRPRAVRAPPSTIETFHSRDWRPQRICNRLPFHLFFSMLCFLYSLVPGQRQFPCYKQSPLEHRPTKIVVVVVVAAAAAAAALLVLVLVLLELVLVLLLLLLLLLLSSLLLLLLLLVLLLLLLLYWHFETRPCSIKVRLSRRWSVCVGATAYT